MTGGSGDPDDIDLQQAYSDDDSQLYFTEKELIQCLFRLEDENL